MLHWLRDAIVRTLAQRWLSNSPSSWRSLISPDSPAAVAVAGPDPDRILLIGGGISVGWGMKTHNDALGGHLTKSISMATGRGVSMDVMTDDILTGTAALPSDVTRVLRAVDAVIITPGDVDAMLLLPTVIYRRRLEQVLDQVIEAAPVNVRVFVVAIAPLSTVVALPRPLRRLASRLGVALDQKARQVCLHRDNAVFVPFSPTGIAGREGSGRTYAAWAGLIAPCVSQHLDSCSGRSIR